MRTYALLTAVLLPCASLLVACSCEPPPPIQQEATKEAYSDVQEYFAKYTSPCGMRLLDISTTEAGPFESVRAAGPEAPHKKLREHVWENNRFIVRGRFTGKHRRSVYCEHYREFEVLSFRPWGPIDRCVALGALRGALQVYAEELPKDRYVPEDFRDGPELPMVDDEHCRDVKVCAEDEKRITACTGGRYCCRLLPMIPTSDK
jgi:hypothetical protein